MEALFSSLRYSLVTKNEIKYPITLPIAKPHHIPSSFILRTKANRYMKITSKSNALCMAKIKAINTFPSLEMLWMRLFQVEEQYKTRK